MATAGPPFTAAYEPASPLDDPSDADSLPESGTSTSSDESLQIQSDADREWRESLQQVELLLTMVLIPYVGKYFGRKMAYWSRSFLSLSGSASDTV